MWRTGVQWLTDRERIRRNAARLARGGGGFVADCVDLVWPRRCVACGSDAAGIVCDACALDVDELAREPACPRCGRSVGGSACPHCGGRGLAHLEAVVRLGAFDPPLSDLVRVAKFAGRPEVCGWLGRRLAGRLEGNVAASAIVVPVALHTRRARRRGYDQALLLSRGLAGPLGLAVEPALSRVRATRPQTRLAGASARAANLRDAFAVSDAEAVVGRDVLVVDDVTTSGSTLRAAARALRRAGPSSVTAVVVAVADRRQERALEFEDL